MATARNADTCAVVGPKERGRIAAKSNRLPLQAFLSRAREAACHLPLGVPQHILRYVQPQAHRQPCPLPATAGPRRVAQSPGRLRWLLETHERALQVRLLQCHQLNKANPRVHAGWLTLSASTSLATPKEARTALAMRSLLAPRPSMHGTLSRCTVTGSCWTPPGQQAMSPMGVSTGSLATAIS